MATEPLLGAERERSMSFRYSSATDTAQLVEESGSVNMAERQGEGGGLMESQALSSMEDSLRQRSTSSRDSANDDFFRVEVRRRPFAVALKSCPRFFFIEQQSVFSLRFACPVLLKVMFRSPLPPRGDVGAGRRAWRLAGSTRSYPAASWV